MFLLHEKWLKPKFKQQECRETEMLETQIWRKKNRNTK